MRHTVQDVRADGCYYSFKPPVCEICKSEFPVTLQPDSGKFSDGIALLSTLPEVKPPFIVLSIPRCSGSDRERPHGERFIFSPGEGSSSVLRIGRSSAAELKVTDVSVSRVHAMINFEDGEFVLFDNDAKFHTLVLPTGPKVLQDNDLSVQVGRTMLSFALLPQLLRTEDAEE